MIRMPLHPVALDLLRLVGPMAVSSANRSGSPPATSAAAAEDQLGDQVAVYLMAGRHRSASPRPWSTSPARCRGCCVPVPSRWTGIPRGRAGRRSLV